MTVFFSIVFCTKKAIAEQEISEEQKAEFVNNIAEQIEPIARDNDLYPSIVIAQAIIASDYGQSTVSQAPVNNLFGIKGKYNGEYVERSNDKFTTEYRKYPSLKESIQDYVDLMKKGNPIASDYYHGAWRSQTTDRQEAIDFLSQRYAVDDSYAEQVNALIDSYHLENYDQLAEEEKPATEEEKKTDVEKAVEGTYQVQQNEQLWSIAEENGITVKELMQINRLTSTHVVAGQWLEIPSKEKK